MRLFQGIQSYKPICGAAKFNNFVYDFHHRLFDDNVVFACELDCRVRVFLNSFNKVGIEHERRVVQLCKYYHISHSQTGLSAAEIPQRPEIFYINAFKRNRRNKSNFACAAAGSLPPPRDKILNV